MAYPIRRGYFSEMLFPTWMEQRCDVCIVGAGIAGLAAAIAIRRTHPNLVVVIVDKDASIHHKHQGYGLTIQPGRKALVELGIWADVASVHTPSLGHVFVQPDGTHIGCDVRPDARPSVPSADRCTARNVHIPRHRVG